MTEDVNALEREIEETLDRLGDTIDQLVHRVHPKTIVGRQVETTKAYFVDAQTGAPRTDNILKVAGGVVATIVVLAVVRRVVK